MGNAQISGLTARSIMNVLKPCELANFVFVIKRNKNYLVNLLLTGKEQENLWVRDQFRRKKLSYDLVMYE